MSAHLHVIKASFISEISESRSKVKITSEYFNHSKVVELPCRYADAFDALKIYLEANGFTIVGTGIGKTCCYVLTNVFKSLYQS